MGSLSDYLEGKLALLGTDVDMPAAPTTWYFAAHAGDPTDAGSANEVTDIGRVAVTAATGMSAVGSDLSNVADIEFPAATVDAGDVSHWSMWDDPTAGNCWFVDYLTDAAGDPLPVAIDAGDVLRFPAGQIVVTFD